MRFAFVALGGLIIAAQLSSASPLRAQSPESEMPSLKEGPTRAIRNSEDKQSTNKVPIPATEARAPASQAAETTSGKQDQEPDVPKAKKPSLSTPAKDLFGAQKLAANLKARAVGFYSKGCLAGAERLPDNGPSWQAMRLSRNRHWGHPQLIALLKRFAHEVQTEDGWPGLLMGDISQPRGGPMVSGHASHQVGLDADIWLDPMPDRHYSAREREDISATSVLAEDLVSVNPELWRPGHVKIIKRMASYSAVERILVHPAIKKALCEAAGEDRKWLGKIRPYWGHHYHFHVRIKCPAGSPACRAQSPPSGDDGCGKEIAHWLELVKPEPPPRTEPKKKETASKHKPSISLGALPAECRRVLAADPVTPPETSEAAAAGH